MLITIVNVERHARDNSDSLWLYGEIFCCKHSRVQESLITIQNAAQFLMEFSYNWTMKKN